jgi:D-amino-acid dehydrogenase
MKQCQRAVVVGDGIVGLSAALYLLRDGWTVTIVGRSREAIGGTAVGSAGLVAVQTVQPLALPSIWKQIPRLLLDRNAPIAVDPRYLPRALPWFVRLLRSSASAQVDRLSVALAWLLGRAYEGYAGLLTEHEFNTLLRRSGLVTVYRTAAQIAAAETELEIRRRRAVRLRVIGSSELRQLVPALSPEYRRGVFYEDCSHVPDIDRLFATILETFQREGGRYIADTIYDFTRGGGKIEGVIGKSGTYNGDLFIIACGAWSRPLAAHLGMRIPLDAERGYHMMLPTSGVDMRLPIIIGDVRVAITPMCSGLRLAGMIEFAGLKAPPNPRRHALLLHGAQRCIPGVNTNGARYWMGFRPSLPDSLPVISALPRHPNVVLAFGHGHLGLTLGPITGRLVRDIAAGRVADEDILPFRADRFRPATWARAG